MARLAPLALLLGIVHAELPLNGMFVLALLLGILLAGLRGGVVGAADVGDLGGILAATGALVCIGLEQEGMARRTFSSKRVCDAVLDRLQTVAEDLLPPSVVVEVRRRRFGAAQDSPGPPGLVVHNKFDVVSVLQTDLAGFTALSRTLQPEEVLGMLNELFGAFDSLVGAHGVFKMETVGDAYICASGLPDFSDGQHRPEALLRLAMDMHLALAEYCLAARCALQMRAGLHSGPAIGGVVGSTMQRYHLFGSTMRTAEALESTAPNGSLHISSAARRALQVEPGVALPPRVWARDAREGGDQLILEFATPVVADGGAERGLRTSKDEFVPLRDLGGHETFVVWPPRVKHEPSPQQQAPAPQVPAPKIACLRKHPAAAGGS